MEDLILILDGNEDDDEEEEKDDDDEEEEEEQEEEEEDGTDGHTRIATCHQVMMNASPFFRAMLQADRFREGQELAQRRCLELPLPDTHSGAMAILCNIFHLATDKVPTASIDPDMLYKLSVLVDKFACARAVQPWPKIWRQEAGLEAYADKLYRSTNHDEKEMEQGKTIIRLIKWIHVSYQLELPRDLDMFTSNFYKFISPEMFEDPTFEGMFEKLPQVMTDSFHSRRDTFIAQVNMMFENLLSRLRSGKSCRDIGKFTVFGQVAANTTECSSILLGNAVIALNQHYQFDWKFQHNWSGSMYSIRCTLDQIASKITGLPSFYGTSNSHNECSRAREVQLRIAKLYEEATRGFESPSIGSTTSQSVLSDDERTNAGAKIATLSHEIDE